MPAVPLDPLIHFNATLAEISQWLCSWLPSFNLHCAIESHPPTVVVTDVPWQDPDGVLAVLMQHQQAFMRFANINPVLSKTRFTTISPLGSAGLSAPAPNSGAREDVPDAGRSIGAARKMGTLKWTIPKVLRYRR